MERKIIITGTLRLIRDAKGWAIDFADTDAREEVARLFRTTIIPLPFTLHADKDVVRLNVQASHPMCEVVIDTGITGGECQVCGAGWSGHKVACPVCFNPNPQRFTTWPRT